MSVLINTSAGDIVIDLFIDQCPKSCQNFLKLCSIKYYNNCLFYHLQSNFLIQTGDPTGTGKGGNSIFGLINQRIEYFPDELDHQRQKKLNQLGLVGYSHCNQTENTNKSDFFITLREDDLQSQLSSYTIFGEVVEGFDVLEVLNNLYCDAEGRPYQDVRIRHTYILDDPTGDVPGLAQLMPSTSPDDTAVPTEERVKQRIPYEEFGADGIDRSKEQMTEEELDQSIRRKEAKSRAIVLEMTGDLPDADVKPPEEVLFVCKLNPVTTDEDLELIFSRFGKIKSCEVIRDQKTGDSLNYAFIEFETEASCIEAYEKMNNVLIDDRRIKVDFSQSVSKLWNRFLMKPRSEKKSEEKDKQPSYYMPQQQQRGADRIDKQHLQNDSRSQQRGGKDERDRTQMSIGSYRDKDRNYRDHRDEERGKDRYLSHHDRHRDRSNSHVRYNDRGRKHDDSRRRDRSRDRENHQRSGHRSDDRHSKRDRYDRDNSDRHHRHHGRSDDVRSSNKRRRSRSRSRS